MWKCVNENNFNAKLGKCVLQAPESFPLECGNRIKRNEPALMRKIAQNRFILNTLKKAGYSHRTAQPLILAAFRPWGGSAGAGRVRPAGANIRDNDQLPMPDAR